MRVWTLWQGPGFCTEGPTCEVVDDVIAEIEAYEEDEPSDEQTTPEGRQAFKELLAVLRPGEAACYYSKGNAWSVECEEMSAEEYAAFQDWEGW